MLRTELVLRPADTYVVAQYAHYSEKEGLSQQFLLDFAVVVQHHVGEEGELLEDSTPERLQLDETDLLTLLQAVPALTLVGSQPVGLALHRKCYAALLRLNPQAAVELHFGEQEGPSREDVQPQLQVLKRRARRRRKKSED